MPQKPKITKKAEWYYRRVGREYGPVTYRELELIASEGRLHPENDFVKTSSMHEWIAAGEIDGLISHTKESGSSKVANWKMKSSGGWIPVQSTKCVGITGFSFFSLASSTLYYLLHYAPKNISFSTNTNKYVEITMWLFLAAAVLCALEIISHAWKAIQPFGTKLGGIWPTVLLLIPIVNLVAIFWLLPRWAFLFSQIKKSDKRLSKLPYTPIFLFIPACMTPYLAVAGYLLETPSKTLSLYCFIGLFLPWWIALFLMTRGINGLVKIYWDQRGKGYWRSS